MAMAWLWTGMVAVSLAFGIPEASVSLEAQRWRARLPR